MSLIAKADVEARLGRALTAEESTAFTLINQANQVYVEKWLGSSVEQASEATRYYDGGLQHMKIDPCTNITAVKWVDQYGNVTETFLTTDYTLEPINRTLKTMIRYRYGKFYDGFNCIAVTGKFSIYGDSDILALVKNALLDAIVSEVDSSDNIVKESIEGYSVEFAKTATKNSLDSIKFLFPEVI